jgi:hypothetical protein
VWIDDGDVRLAEIDPPDSNSETWQSRPVEVMARGKTTEIKVTLSKSAAASESVQIRDVAFFARHADLTIQDHGTVPR